MFVLTIRTIFLLLLVNVYHLAATSLTILQQDRDVLNAFHGYVRTYWLLHRDGFLSDVDDDSSRSTSPEITLQSTEKSGGETIYGSRCLRSKLVKASWMKKQHVNAFGLSTVWPNLYSLVFCYLSWFVSDKSIYEIWTSVTAVVGILTRT